jgi:hypothetical protein
MKNLAILLPLFFAFSARALAAAPDEFACAFQNYILNAPLSLPGQIRYYRDPGQNQLLADFSLGVKHAPVTFEHADHASAIAQVNGWIDACLHDPEMQSKNGPMCQGILPVLQSISRNSVGDVVVYTLRGPRGEYEMPILWRFFDASGVPVGSYMITSVSVMGPPEGYAVCGY